MHQDHTSHRQQLYNWTVSFVGCFAKLVLTGLLAGWAEQYTQNQEGIKCTKAEEQLRHYYVEVQANPQKMV